MGCTTSNDTSHTGLRWSIVRDSVVRVSRRVEHRPQNGDEEQEGCEQQQVPQLDSELDAGRGVSTCSVTMAPPLRSPACPPPFCRARPAVIAEHCSRVPPRSLGQLGGRYAGRRMLLHPLPVVHPRTRTAQSATAEPTTLEHGTSVATLLRGRSSAGRMAAHQGGAAVPTRVDGQPVVSVGCRPCGR